MLNIFSYSLSLLLFAWYKLQSLVYSPNYFCVNVLKKKKKKKGTSTIYYTSYIMQNEFNFVFNLIANYEQYT